MARPKEVDHDQSPSIIDSHPFEPKGEWWSLCGFLKADGTLCNLSESAHTQTTNENIREDVKHIS